MEKWDEIFYRGLALYIEDCAQLDTDTPWPDQMDVYSDICGWQLMRDECESPIEKILGAQLYWATDGYNRIEYVHAHQFGTLEYPKFGTFMWPQGQIGEYRADFLLTACVKKSRAIVVVECDGHDFHERTKEQARRDKSRDRFMATRGITVLRFTGSEIYRNPEACAEEVTHALSMRLEEMMRAENLMPRADREEGSE